MNIEKFLEEYVPDDCRDEARKEFGEFKWTDFDVRPNHFWLIMSLLLWVFLQIRFSSILEGILLTIMLLSFGWAGSCGKYQLKDKR